MDNETKDYNESTTTIGMTDPISDNDGDLTIAKARKPNMDTAGGLYKQLQKS